MFNTFDAIKIICWGELNNINKIGKLIPNITEGQKEEWQSSFDFFNKQIQDCDSKYYLLIDDNAEIINQKYFFKVISIFEQNPIVNFIYTDYNKILLPSFKPYIFRHLQNNHGFPIFCRNKKNNLILSNENEDKYKNYLSEYINVISSVSVGYHIAEPLIRMYE